jgi:UDP-N-acetylmuramyl pentapeptide phosphotransferase/UDP-N-acetylglucosamine-1-phosphate transferase
VVDAGVLGAIDLARPWSTVLTVLWVAWFINAFNFMDGIDGIAGGQAMAAGLGWVALGLVTATPVLTLAGALLAGASVGFLAHNWSPASIFMGDVGSAMLGFLLATVPWAVGRADLWLATVLLVWPFVFDAFVTLCRRALRGERVWEAHRTHLYQRLVVRGTTHRATSTLYVALACVGLVCATALVTGPPALARGMVIAVGLAGAGLWFLVSRAEARPTDVRISSDA